MGPLVPVLSVLLVFTGGSDARHSVVQIVQKIQRADYEGDRAALKRLHDKLGPYISDRDLGPRVLYWRGFAMWRRGLNGFNDHADPKELAGDLQQCVIDFENALKLDPAFVDAKGGDASCLVNESLLMMNTDRSQAREMFLRSASLLKEALATTPDNPRLLWVEGANQFYSRESDGQEQAIATYERGLEFARQQKDTHTDPLKPAWGEPELLMNLAFANAHKAVPDPAAAKRYAESALSLVPYWHYVRDILLIQIQKAINAGNK